ncbi:hypothetical protein ACHAXS_003401 [Conticribra weissflogii]
MASQPRHPPPPAAGGVSQPPTPSIPRVPVEHTTFDENHLPSVLHDPDPMTPEAERQARRRTCRFIEEAGQRSLRLPRVAVATATVFFHRFYAKHAFQEHDRFEVAMACLLLAGKTEESPKKLDLVLRECWKLRRRAQEQQQRKLSQGGESPSMAGSSPSALTSPPVGENKQIDPKSEEYARLKERVLLLERVILHTIGFELSIDHPYKFLVDCVQNLNSKKLLEAPTSFGNASGRGAQNTQMVQSLAQNAMNFANDSMHTSLCLQFTAKEIALACVYLSGKYAGINPAGGKSWLDLLEGITVEDLVSISVQILELVQPRKGMDSENSFRAIRKDLDEMSMGCAPDSKRQKI